jgi:proton-dependent oligopeptide transporter, POT family
VGTTAPAVPVTATATDRPPVFDDRALFGHPRGIALLFFTEMWERFSYYGMRAILVLYLVNALRWPEARAFTLYGTYTGLVYLTPLFGGYLADRVIGTRRSLVIGGVIIALGHFVLALQSPTTFYVGLALVIVGTGFFKPNVSTMVGQLYREGDPRRDAGFTIFYMGINTGAFVAPFVCGWLGQRVGWHYGFGAAGVGMVLGLVTYLWGRATYLPGVGLTPTQTASATGTAAPRPVGRETPGHERWWHGVIGAAVGLAIAWALHGGWMGFLYGVSIGGALGLMFLGSRGEERLRVVAIFVVFVFVTVFWMAFEQAGSSMTVFADQHTNRLLGTFDVPASWFQSVEPLGVLVFAPVFALLWQRLGRAAREPSTPIKMVYGLVLLGVGMLLMVLAGRIADSGVRAAMWWLVGAYLFHAFGELALSPVGLSYVTKVAPARFGSLLMGVWFLALSAANFLGGVVAAYGTRMSTLSSFFMLFVVTSAAAALGMLLLTPALKRLTASVRA